MHRIAFLAAVTLGTAAIAPLSSYAREPADAAIAAEAPVIRAGGGGATAAAYLTINNPGTRPDRLLGATISGAADTSLHRSEIAPGGISRMRPVSGGLSVPARGRVMLQPGGLHLMLMGLKQPLRPGDRVPGTLVLARAGVVKIIFVVAAPASPPNAGAGAGAGAVSVAASPPR